MHIRLIDGDIPTTSGMLGFVHARIAAAVGRLVSQVREVRVRITDVNGPKRGIDKECVMIAVLDRGGRAEVIVRRREADFYAAIAGAAHALKPAVARRVGRGRDR